MNPSNYPSVTIVAGEVRYVKGITSPLLRMHDGATYIQISPALARQWISELEKVDADAPKSPESSGFSIE